MTRAIAPLTASDRATAIRAAAIATAASVPTAYSAVVIPASRDPARCCTHTHTDSNHMCFPFPILREPPACDGTVPTLTQAPRPCG